MRKEHEHDLGPQHQRPDDVGRGAVDARDVPTTEEQRGRDGGQGEGSAELRHEEEQEAEAGVLGHVARDQLGLGHRHVEGRLGELRLRRDEEEGEADELGEDERIAQRAEAEDLAVGLDPDDACMLIVPAWITTPITASTSGSS